MNLRLSGPSWPLYALLLGGAATVAGATEPAAPAPLHQRFPLSAADAKDSIEAPDIAVTAAAKVYLTWASRTGDAERTVFLTERPGPGRDFAAPRALGTAGIYRSAGRGGRNGHERRATPHLAVDGDLVELTWSEPADGGGMRLLLAQSRDDFRARVGLHRQPANATFTGLASGPGGALAATWLGDRAGCQQPYAALRPRRGAAVDEERRVHAGAPDQGVCPCCPTAATFAPDGTLFVAFRNIDAGHRDIAVARLRPGQDAFDAAVPVVPHTWELDGCPHDGPSLAVAGDTLHVAWMDAHTGTPRCYHARASCADLKFTARELHPGPGSQGNPKLRAAADGGIHAVWEQSQEADSSRAIVHAYLAPGQAQFGAAQPVALRRGAFQSRPALALVPGGALWIAWNELDEAGKAVVVAQVPAVPRAEVLERRGVDAPPLVLADAAGKQQRLEDLRGRLVLLHFWSSDCPACLRELRSLHELQTALQDRPLTVLHVCVDADNAAAAQATIERIVPAARAWIAVSEVALARYQLQALPCCWLIGPDGKAIARRQGASHWSRSDLEPWLASGGR